MLTRFSFLKRIAFAALAGAFFSVNLPKITNEPTKSEAPVWHGADWGTIRPPFASNPKEIAEHYAAKMMEI